MKPIRIALSGSGYKAPVHAGALMAVYDAGFEPVEYAGTSGGSIVAALAACGMPPHDMMDLVMKMDWSSFLKFEAMTLLTKQAYCSGDRLLAWLKEQTKGATFADLKTDLTIMSSDINHRAPFRWSKQTTPQAPLAIASRASASIPFVYAPVQYQGITHQDGGMANNIPVMRLVRDSAPRLGVDLTVTSAFTGALTFKDIVAADLEIMLSSNESTQVALALSSGAKIAFVETGYCNGLDANMPVALRQRLASDGYAAAKAQLAGL